MLPGGFRLGLPWATLSAGSAAGRVGQPLHDRGGGLGRRDRRPPCCSSAEDLAAGRVDQRVEPHRQALVLGALFLDVVRLALLGELDRVVDHLGPGLGRVGHQVLAVPEQLGVGVDRGGVELAVPGGGLQRAGQHALADRGGVGAGPGPDPLGGRELRGPVDVHGEDVDRESPAASRRTSDTRCWSDEVERKLILMLYLPPEAVEHSWRRPSRMIPRAPGTRTNSASPDHLPDEPPHAASATVAQRSNRQGLSHPALVTAPTAASRFSHSTALELLPGLDRS